LNTKSVIIIGTGQAGFQTAHSLRQGGFTGKITLIGDESHLPYQRPPLSKAFMLGVQGEEGLLLRQPDFYAQNNIDIIIDQRVAAINRTQKQVQLAGGQTLHYDHLVLATGARVRKLELEGENLDGVMYMRSMDDAKNIKARMEHSTHIVVIGGGFIGLEFAAVARKFGKKVTVIEAQSRLMVRAVAPVMSDFFANQHKNHGVNLLFNTHIERIIGDTKVSSIQLKNGEITPADLVVVGIGVIANEELAQEAGLTCQNGIMVDEYLATNDPAIYAIGDCVQHYNAFAHATIRVESVQNAIDQAKCVVANIMGDKVPYKAVPWFWSDQYDLKLQMVGINTGFDLAVTRGDIASHKFSVFMYKNGQLIGIDCVNRPADHMLGRKLIGQGLNVPPEIAQYENADLKAYLTKLNENKSH
jgi:3-phenylpropionate/trans-cinnamate dioxygenase ferredoxin reductase component